MMCKLCNGTHVYHAYDDSKALFQTCPECGPEPVEAVNQRMAELRRKIHEAAKLYKEGA